MPIVCTPIPLWKCRSHFRYQGYLDRFAPFGGYGTGTVSQGAVYGAVVGCRTGAVPNAMAASLLAFFPVSQENRYSPSRPLQAGDQQVFDRR
jgi:hypothetical protein